MVRDQAITVVPVLESKKADRRALWSEIKGSYERLRRDRARFENYKRQRTAEYGVDLATD